MRRLDAFLLGMTAFLLANCVSYVALSSGLGGPHGGPGGIEEIGFPLVFLTETIGLAHSYDFNWTHAIADVGTALVIGLTFVYSITDSTPPLWPNHSWTLRYSMTQLLTVTGVIVVLIAVGREYPGWGLLIWNLICYAGPSLYFFWLLQTRQLSWLSLACGGLGMLLVTLALSFSNLEIFVLAPYHIVWYVARPAVPILGILSFLILASAVYPSARQWYDQRQHTQFGEGD